MTQLGKYTLIEKIGEGAFGEVYQATDNLRRVVATCMSPGQYHRKSFLC